MSLEPADWEKEADSFLTEQEKAIVDHIERVNAEGILDALETRLVAAKQAVEDIEAQIASVKERLSQKIYEVADDVADFVSDVVEEVGETLEDASDFVSDVLENLVDFVDGDAKDAVEDVKDAAQGVVSDASDAAQEVVEKVVAKAADVIKAIEAAVSVEEVKELLGDDTRTTVVKAAEKRIAELDA